MSQVTYSNVAITKVLLLRGNTIQNARYLGLPGEPTIDLEAKTLRIHDGTTVGGHEIESTANLSSYSGNIIPSANNVYSLGSITNQWQHLYVSSNTIYIGGTPLTITNGNLTVGGNVVTGSGGGNVANLWNSGYTVSLASDGTTTFPNNLNFAASQQLYVSGNGNNNNFIGFTANNYNDINGIQIGEVNQGATIYTSGAVQLYTNTAGATALWTFNTDGTTTFPDGSVQSTAYSNATVHTYLASSADQVIGGNLTVLGNLLFNGNATLIATNNLIINDNIIYVANANPGSSLDIGFAGHFTAGGIYQHTGLVRQASSNQWKLFSNVAAEPGNTIDFTYAKYDDLQVGNITSPTIDTLNANAVAQQTQINTLNANAVSQQSQIYTLQTNAATQSDLIIGINANVIAANVGMLGYVNSQVTAANTAWAANASAQQTLISSLQSNASSQETEIQSLFANSYQQQALIGNLQASAYSNINVAAYLTSVGIGGGNYSNINVAAYLAGSITTGNISTGNITAGNISANGTVTGSAFKYANGVSILSGVSYLAGVASLDDTGQYPIIVFKSSANQLVTASGNAGSVPTYQPHTGGMNAWTFSAQSTTGNGVTSQSSISATGNIYAIGNVIAGGNVNATYFVGNGAFLTGIAASSNYSNVQVAQYLQVGNIANISVAGNVTATYFVGNGSQLTGLPATYSNIQTAAYLNATGYNLYSNVNVAAYLSTQGITAYSNVQVATYLPTYSGNVANIRLGVAGVLTFADGTTMTTAAVGGGSSYSNVNVAAYLNTQGYNLYSNVNVANYLTTATITTTGNITAGNLSSTYGLYVANITTTGSSGNISGANYITANVILTNGGYGNISNVANLQANAVLVSGNVTATYFLGNGALLTGIAASSSYSNVQVATYLPTYTGNIANVRLGVSGVLTFADGTTMTTAAVGGGSSYSNVNVAAYLATGVSSNIVASTGAYFVGNLSATTTMQYSSGQGGLLFTKLVGGTGAAIYSLNVTPSAQNYALSTNGAALNLNAPTGGGVYTSINNTIVTSLTAGYLNVAGNVSAANVSAQYLFGDGSNLTNVYSNVNVTNYLPTYSGNIANVRLGVSGALTFADGTTMTTAATGGGSNYSNVNVKAYTETIGLTNYSNVNVKAYTETIGLTNYANVNAKAYTETIGLTNYSNVNVTSYLAGNITVGNIVGAQPNVYIQAGAYTSVFDNFGNVTVPKLFTAGNIQTAGYLFGNGAFLTGITTASSSYSNVQVATYLPTYSGNIANITLSPSGQITFADGTIQTSAGGGSYSNVQVAAYLPTYSGNVANIRLGNSGVLTFADGTAQTTAANYSNSNVSSYLISSNAVFIGNTGNVSVANIYPLQSNIQQFFIGSQTSILSGAALTPAITYLLNNLYFDAAGNQKYRNTQTGATSFSMGSAGFSWAGTTGAVTANAASGIGSWLSLSGSGLSTNNSLPITAAGALTTTSGTLNSGAATAALFNTTATTINMGGVASTITMGSTNGIGNVFFGGNAIIQATNGAVGTTLYPLVLRPQGQYNYLLLYGIAGGYNAPPYTAQALTGGSGTGMTASYSTAGNGYVTQASLVVVNPGTGYKNGDVLTLPGGLGTTVILYNYNPAKTSNTAASSYTFGFDGNLTLPGNIIFPSSSYIYGDFSNATVNSRTVFVTTGNSTTTGIYAAPSGTGTGAAWQAANSSNLTAASKIMITTNGSTDVQLVSGINGAGTYLPLSFYNNGAAQMQLTVAGNLTMTLNNSIETSGTGNHIGNAVGTTATYTGNVTVGNLIGTQYGNTVGTTATYTGNVTVGNLSVTGNLSANLLSITANSITGTGANTYITAGAYTSTFNNAGNVLMPNVIVSGTVYATNFVGNITSGSTGNLNVVGNLISTGYGYFPGAYNESATTSGVFIGNTGSGTPSPRIGFYNGNTTQNWQVDNYFGQFRWFTPGVTQMTLDPTGSLSVTNATVTTLTVNGNANVAGTGGISIPNRPAFRVIGQGGSITVGGNIVASNWTVDYTQGNSAAYLNGTNGTFTAPVAGLYQTSLTARTTSNTNGSIIQAVIQQIKSGSASVAMMIEWNANTTFNHASGSTTVKLAVGDKLYVTCLASGAPNGTGFSFDGNDHWDVVYLG